MPIEKILSLNFKSEDLLKNGINKKYLSKKKISLKKLKKKNSLQNIFII
jgi:hypothetical protein